MKAYLCIQAREIDNKTFSCYSQTLAVKNAPEVSMAEVYLKSEADKVISTIRAERDEYRYNLSCARNEIHNLSMSMREDVKRIADKDKEIADLKADYKEACDRLQTANLIKDEQLAATRHSKRKRCLAMAKWCDAQVEWYNSLNEDYSFWLDLYVKWHSRWLELAERFKDKDAK